MRTLVILFCTLAALFPAPTGAESADAPERMVCPVCRVKEGATEAEEVRAVRTHDGVAFGFCSDACAAAFDADPPAYLAPRFPRPAPAFALTTLDGDTLTNGSLRGRVALIDFWATWCAPCRKTMPGLDRLHRRLSDRGLTVVGISIDEKGPKPVRRFVTSRKIGYPIAIDSPDAPAWAAFHVAAIPTAFLLDREGRIVAQWTGIPPDEDVLEAAVTKLLATPEGLEAQAEGR